MSLSEQMRRAAVSVQHDFVHSGEVYKLDTVGIWVDLPDEDVSGPHPYMAPAEPEIGTPCLVFDTFEGDRFVIAGFIGG